MPGIREATQQNSTRSGLERAHGSRRRLAQRGPLTFRTSVGLANAEEITPDTTPQITLISNVSSAVRKKTFRGELEPKAVDEKGEQERRFQEGKQKTLKDQCYVKTNRSNFPAFSLLGLRHQEAHHATAAFAIQAECQLSCPSAQLPALEGMPPKSTGLLWGSH